jgi:tetratricopeptide (TPR) repeat protein
LMQTKIKQAKEAFEKAIAVDSADPLSRLGLGLAKIRESNLREGSRELEAAASLDPGNAIVRSYLGKAYYEEKRTGLDEREYAEAKKLDPNDPTPHFYDAIAKQTTNRPVEALQEMERAIELNDNRAVYRSRLLLDSDEASRSAALGRIYTDLGFQQLALVEGWKSVNIDPTNYSAHRLLADTYAVLPRHEVARVSELLQSQLLQPLNMTPIQPRLAEANLFLISAGGPGSLSFNEFNPIFSRDGATLQITGLGGSNATWAGEGVVAGLYQNLSVSVGYTHFTTDGWRTNADQEDDIANAFVQYALTPQTSLQAEYRFRKSEFGDILLRFHPEDFFPGQRNTEESRTVRLGARHAFSPNSILLVSASYQNKDSSLSDAQFPQAGVLLQDLRVFDETALGIEVEHIFRSRYVNLRTGVGYVNSDSEIESEVTLGPPLIPFIFQASSATPAEIDHYNAYVYADLNLLKTVTFTLGMSYDTLTGDFPGDNTDQFNPKAGITWNPLTGTTVRGGVSRVLKRTLVTEQTLEPTQVAGFNQFFDDPNLTDAWRYGVAIDQKFSKSIFAGVELSRRDMTVPFLDFTVDPVNPPTSEADWKEKLARAYAFWTPYRWVALRAEYSFERLERDDVLPAGVTEADTHRVPLGISFFHPSGISSFLTATYYNQDGEFGGITAATPIRSGSDKFWLVDAAVSYRLPLRYGFVTLGVTNLFDENFKYFDNDLRNASIQPDRMVFGRVTVALP